MYFRLMLASFFMRLAQWFVPKKLSEGVSAERPKEDVVLISTNGKGEVRVSGVRLNRGVATFIERERDFGKDSGEKTS